MQKTPDVRAVDSTLSATNERRACNAQSTTTIQPVELAPLKAGLVRAR
jgi:hypothetical protein